MNDEVDKEVDKSDIDFGYSTAIAGFTVALILVVVMFASPGRV